MKLEQLRPNLCELPAYQAFALFLDYCEKRAEDIATVVVTPKKPGNLKTTRKKKDEVTVSQKDLELLKKMGLI
jgi:hypothetical protein